MTQHSERLTVRRTDSVPEAARVRHVDQLSAEAFDALVGMADGASRRVTGVEPGDVVVFTSYLEVVPAGPERGVGRHETADADERRAGAGPVG